MTSTSIMEVTASIKSVPNFIGGRWKYLLTENFNNIYNPSTGEIIGKTPLSGQEVVDEAVQTTTKAFASWSQLPAPRRADVLFRYRTIL